MPRLKPDEVKVARTIYVESEKHISLDRLATEHQGDHGLSVTTLKRWSKEQGWTKLREKHWAEVTEKARKRTATKQSYNLQHDIEQTAELRDEAHKRAMGATIPDTFSGAAGVQQRTSERLRRLTSDKPEGLQVSQELLDRLLSDD